MYRRKKTVPEKKNKKNLIEISKFKNMFYSFECDYSNNINLIAYIYEGTESAKIDLVLKNDGTLDWTNNTKLIFDKKSEVKGNDVKLKPQKINEVQKYEIILNNLGSLKDGEYKSYVKVYIDGLLIGEELTLKLKVKKKELPDEEMNNNMDKIIEFREAYDLDEIDYPNKKVFEALKANDFEFEPTFVSLFN
jgi:hypothetical protein